MKSWTEAQSQMVVGSKIKISLINLFFALYAASFWLSQLMPHLSLKLTEGHGACCADRPWEGASLMDMVA